MLQSCRRSAQFRELMMALKEAIAMAWEAGALTTYLRKSVEMNAVRSTWQEGRKKASMKTPKESVKAKPLEPSLASHSASHGPAP